MPNTVVKNAAKKQRTISVLRNTFTDGEILLFLVLMHRYVKDEQALRNVKDLIRIIVA